MPFCYRAELNMFESYQSCSAVNFQMVIASRAVPWLAQSGGQEMVILALAWYRPAYAIFKTERSRSDVAT